MSHTVFVARDSQIASLMDAIAEGLVGRGLLVTRGPEPAPGQKLVYEPSVHGALFGQASALVFSNHSICSRDVLSAAPKARGVVYPAVGVDTLDVEAATELGLIVGHGAVPENTQGMAEATVMFVLALSLQLRRSERSLTHFQNKPPPSRNWVRQLKGKTVGFVGFGRIAHAVSLLLQPFGVTMVAFQPGRSLPVGGPVRQVELGELLQTSDFVSVHVTLNAGTKRLIGRYELAMMKPTAYLVNTSRGSVIDEAALIESLQMRRIAGAALDTFEVEPLPADSPLRQLDNVLLTPHMVGQTQEAYAALVPTAIQNIENILAGRLPVYCKNPEAADRWLARAHQPESADR